MSPSYETSVSTGAWANSETSKFRMNWAFFDVIARIIWDTTPNTLCMKNVCGINIPLTHYLVPAILPAVLGLVRPYWVFARAILGRRRYCCALIMQQGISRIDGETNARQRKDINLWSNNHAWKLNVKLMPWQQSNRSLVMALCSDLVQIRCDTVRYRPFDQGRRQPNSIRV